MHVGTTGRLRRPYPCTWASPEKSASHFRLLLTIDTVVLYYRRRAILLTIVTVVPTSSSPSKPGN
jgi:hypothetical protein